MIKEYQDAYGAELRAFLETGAKVEIVERDDGYIDSQNAAYIAVLKKKIIRNQ